MPATEADTFRLTDESANPSEKGKPVTVPTIPAKKQRGGTKPNQKKRSGRHATGGGSFDFLPQGKAVDTALDDLSFLPECQKRTTIYDEDTVTEYANIYAEALEKDKKTAHLAIGELRAIDTGDAREVYDGFQRGEAARRAGLEFLPVVITKGTHEDAEFYSCRANAGRALSRSSDDCKRALASIVDNDAMLARVSEKVKEYGGMNRALSAASGTSKGFVSNFLRNRGQTVRGDKIVKLPTPPAPKPPKKKSGKPETGQQSGSLFDQPDAATETVDTIIDRLKAENKWTPENGAEEAKKINLMAARIMIHEALKTAARLARLTENLVINGDVGKALETFATAQGVPFQVKEDVNPTHPGEKLPELVAEKQWPVLSKIIAALESTRDSIAEEPATEDKSGDDAKPSTNGDGKPHKTAKKKTAKKSKK